MINAIIQYKSQIRDSGFDDRKESVRDSARPTSFIKESDKQTRLFDQLDKNRRTYT